MSETESCADGDGRLPNRIRPWLRVVKLLLATLAAALGIVRSLGTL